MTVHKHTCKCCQKDFTNERRTAVFCSYACRNIFHSSPDGKPSTPEKKKAAVKAWASRNGDYFREKAAEYYQKNSQKPEWRQKQRERNRRDAKQLRHEAIMAYGGYVCSCNHNGVPCGSHPEEFLAIDHIKGEGKVRGEHGGHILFRKLKKRGWPAGYRVLCHNCNCALGFYGYCPLSKTETQPIKRRKDDPTNAALNIAARGADVTRPEHSDTSTQRQCQGESPRL